MRALLIPSLALRNVVVLAIALAFVSPACSSDPSVILPEGYNAKRNRSVTIDNSACYLSASGIEDPVACADESTPTGGLHGTGMRGVNGAPFPVFIDDYAATFATNFAQLSATNMRIPAGYGCAYSLQGLWKGGVAGNTDDIVNNYDLKAFETVLKSVRDANGTPLWTAAFDLAEGGTCTYANGQQAGKPIADPAKWAKIVRRIMKYYDRDLPATNATTSACKGTTGLSWDCFASIFNVEFGRDPFGAGGYTQATKAQWLQAYAQFATELRQEFPMPGNDVRLVAPSVVMSAEPTNLVAVDSSCPVPGTVKNAAQQCVPRSPIYDFIDFVVDNNLPLTDLSIEIETCTPLQARSIVKAVAAYAKTKGLKHEKNFSLESGTIEVKDATGQVVGHHSDGSEPIPIWVTDLRLNCKLPNSIETCPSRKSAYLGAFFAGAKILWQGLVSHSTVGTAPRYPSVRLDQVTKAEGLATAHDSDFMWFSEPGIANTLLKPAAWYQFWFNDGFMAGAQQVSVLEGPDAFGLSGTPDSRRDSGILLMATRETCTDSLGKIRNCIEDPSTSNYPAVDANRKHRMHVFLVDLDVATDDPTTGLGILEHMLRLEVKGLPKDTKTVGYRWAYMDGTDDTWCKPDRSQTGSPMLCKFEFPEQGLLDISDGTFHFSRSVGVPSMHYFEFLY